jgi:hypothetical protein
VFSESKLIENPKGKGNVYNHAKVRIYEDGEVAIYVRYIDPTDYSLKMDESFQTVLHGRSTDSGAVFFASKQE